ncbi:MAG TPA: endonuclease [Acholeplasmatales bacterium]|nr:endonuclease [Acholeplasmatales bacterium]
MVRRIIKITARCLIILLGFLLVVVGGYVGYISVQYYRINDEAIIVPESNPTALLDVSGEYVITTYNIGFGAYDPEFSFFMDSGEMLTGEKTHGASGKAKNLEVVNANTNGAIAAVSAFDPDFLFFQEVDVEADRSYDVDQLAAIRAHFTGHGSVFAGNFHSAYLFYPFHDPIGKTQSGIASFSKYQIDSAVRHQLPIDDSFPAKFFDLDRCFLLTRIPTSDGTDLVLINIHMSAYDAGGLVRQAQLAALKLILEAEKDNYVIVGGDFNHDIAGSINLFPTEQKVPVWVYVLTEADLPDGYRFATANNVGTCRSSDIPYVPGVNYQAVIDGFIVNEKIATVAVTNIENDYLYSDHNPVKLTFRLNG